MSPLRERMADFYADDVRDATPDELASKAYNPDQRRDSHGRWARNPGSRSRDEIRAAPANEDDLALLGVPDRLSALGIKFWTPSTRTHDGNLTNGDYDDMVAGIEIARREFPMLATTERPFDKLIPYSSDGDSAESYNYQYPWSAMLTTVAPGWPDTKMYVNDRLQSAAIGSAEAKRNLSPASASTYVGTALHEMGHTLAYATIDHVKLRGIAQQNAYRALFKKYDITFRDLDSISRYASSSPTESFGELFAMYFTPGYRDQLDPGLRAKAGRMFNDLRDGKLP